MPECRDCGSQDNEVEMLPIYDYDWESDEDTALSIRRVVGYRCLYATDCARRVVAQGTNIRALREIAPDYENLGELATQAQHILDQWADMGRMIARADDAVARENGWGAIGGGR